MEGAGLAPLQPWITLSVLPDRLETIAQDFHQFTLNSRMFDLKCKSLKDCLISVYILTN